MDKHNRDIAKQMLDTFPLKARDHENRAYSQFQKRAKGPRQDRLPVHAQKELVKTEPLG
jgi:hypothetical protein